MVQFHLGENSISFSDDFNKLNTLRTDIIDDMSQFSIYDSMEQLISKHGKMPNIDEVASSFPLMVNQLICEAIVPIIVNFLVENEIYDCSEELFIHRYQERYFNFAKQPQFQNFLSHYVNLANEYMEKRTQKEYNRANRSQWMGGGFGITGAIKGAAQAAVLNAATGVVRGIGDGISDFASSTAYKSKQNSLLSDDVFQEFDIALQNCIHGCILACQIEYSTHKGILCSWSQRENIEKSFAIFNNVQTRVTDTSKIAKLMSTAIELSPYNEEYYSFLYRQDGIDKTEVLIDDENLGVKVTTLPDGSKITEGLMGLEPTLADGIFADDGALVYFFYADEFLPPENGLVAFTAVPLCAGNLVLDDGSEEECLFIACSFMIDGMDFNDTDRIISNDSHTSKTPDEIINEVKNSWYQDNTDVLFGDEFEVLLTNPKWTYDSTLNRVELTGTYTAYDYPWHGIAMPSDTESDTVEKELHIYFEKINGTGRWTPHFDDNYPNDDYPPEEYQEFEVPGRDDDRMHGLMADVLQYYADTGHYV